MKSIISLCFLLFIFIGFSEKTFAQNAIHCVSNSAISNDCPKDSVLIKKAKEINDEATEACKRDDYHEAIELMTKAISYYKEVPDSVQIALLYSDIADVMQYIDEDYEKIIQYYQKSCDLLHRLGYIIEEINRLIRIKKVLYKQGKNYEYAAIAQEITSKLAAVPPSPMLYEMLGEEHYSNNNYSEAIPYFENAINLYEKEGQEDTYYYISLCIKLATSYYFARKYDDALHLTYKIINQDETYNRVESPSHLYSLFQMLQSCYFAQEKIKEAFECSKIAEQKLSKHPSAYARNIPYALLLDACVYTGDYESMIEYAIKSDSILAEEFDESYIGRLYAINLRIGALTQLDRFQEALDLFHHLMQIKKTIYQNKSSEQKTDLRRLANIEAFASANNSQLMDSAKAHMVDYANIEKFEIRSQAPWLSSIERNTFWNNAQNMLQQLAGFAIAANAIREPFTTEVYNAHLLSKGLILQTEKAMADAIIMHGTAENRSVYALLQSLQDSISVAERNQDFSKKAELEIKIRSLENDLILNCSDVSDYASYLNADFNTIHPHLQKGEVLVDFLEVMHTGDKDNSITAFIIRPEWYYPHLMRICRISDIYNISESINSKIYEGNTSSDLCHLLLDSILHYVKPGELIYYVPDGILHGIALENLKANDEKLISEIYDMQRLSSARQVIKKHTISKGKYKDAIIYGALNYGEYVSISKPDSNSDSIERGVGDAYYPLKATEYEIKNIDNILRKAHVNTTCYRNDNGTEESFLALDGTSPAIIHLATHGFYLSPEQAQKVKGLAGYTDAMFLSGLILSGGNAGWLNIQGNNNTMDGLLTSHDIACLDLSKTKLVVLSACKTAVGQNLTDGIFGLQRAFKKAGAESIIMTLWSINDEITALFMTEFYRELVKNKWNKHRAFVKTKEIIKNKYPDPYFWAGFIILD